MAMGEHGRDDDVNFDIINRNTRKMAAQIQTVTKMNKSLVKENMHPREKITSTRSIMTGVRELSSEYLKQMRDENHRLKASMEEIEKKLIET